MSSSLLELIRFNHESAEALETAIGIEVENKPSGVINFQILDCFR